MNLKYVEKPEENINNNEKTFVKENIEPIKNSEEIKNQGDTFKFLYW